MTNDHGLFLAHAQSMSMIDTHVTYPMTYAHSRLLVPIGLLDDVSHIEQSSFLVPIGLANKLSPIGQISFLVPIGLPNVSLDTLVLRKPQLSHFICDYHNNIRCKSRNKTCSLIAGLNEYESIKS